MHQTVSFSNVQKIKVTDSPVLQNIAQLTTVTSNIVTSGKKHATSQATLTWPLKLNYNYVAGSSSATQKAAVVQTKNENGTVTGQGKSKLLASAQHSPIVRYADLHGESALRRRTARANSITSRSTCRAIATIN